MAIKRAIEQLLKGSCYDKEKTNEPTEKARTGVYFIVNETKR
jgi:hypothetical protein